MGDQSGSGLRDQDGAAAFLELRYGPGYSCGESAIGNGAQIAANEESDREVGQQHAPEEGLAFEEVADESSGDDVAKADYRLSSEFGRETESAEGVSGGGGVFEAGEDWQRGSQDCHGKKSRAEMP